MRLEADKEHDRVITHTNLSTSLSVAVSIHERSQNNNRILTTEWNEVAATNYGTSKDIAAAKYVQGKQFNLENCGFFLAILVKTDTAFKASRSYIAARFRPLMLYIINYNLFEYFGEEPLIGTEFIES